LKAQGYERPKSNDGGAAYRAKTETIYARLYAKAKDYSDVMSHLTRSINIVIPAQDRRTGI
jgi:hypothetical protein